MATEKSPAFQFYPKDFIGDANVAEMSMQERGVYITLICYCWDEGSIPSELDRVARLLSMPPKTLAKLWPAVKARFRPLEESNARLVHPRLEKEREKQANHRRRQADRASKRWSSRNAATDAVASPQALPQAMPRHESLQCSSSSSSSSSSIKRREKKEEPPGARSKWPIFKGQRLVVFDWMLEDCSNLVAPHVEAFGFDAFFDRLDRRCVAEGKIPPERDGGKWLKSEVLAEAQRMGLPLRIASVSASEAEAAEMLAEVHRLDERVKW